MTGDEIPAELAHYVANARLHLCAQCLEPVLLRVCEPVAGGDCVRVWCLAHRGTELAVLTRSDVEDSARKWYFVDGPGDPISTREDRRKRELAEELARWRAARAGGTSSRQVS